MFLFVCQKAALNVFPNTRQRFWFSITYWCSCWIFSVYIKYFWECSILEDNL